MNGIIIYVNMQTPNAPIIGFYKPVEEHLGHTYQSGNKLPSNYKLDLPATPSPEVYDPSSKVYNPTSEVFTCLPVSQ